MTRGNRSGPLGLPERRGRASVPQTRSSPWKNKSQALVVQCHGARARLGARGGGRLSVLSTVAATPTSDMERPVKSACCASIRFSAFRLLHRSFDDKPSRWWSKRLSRRLITLIFAGRNRIIVIRRELPRTKRAGRAARPAALIRRGFSIPCAPPTATVPAFAVVSLVLGGGGPRVVDRHPDRPDEPQ